MATEQIHVLVKKINAVSKQQFPLQDTNLETVRYNDNTRWSEGFTPPPEAIKME